MVNWEVTVIRVAREGLFQKEIVTSRSEGCESHQHEELERDSVSIWAEATARAHCPRWKEQMESGLKSDGQSWREKKHDEEAARSWGPCRRGRQKEEPAFSAQ